MPRISLRLSPPRNPVTLTFDGEAITADRGEPIAAALLAAGKIHVARSPKFHRPRGPSCFRAACDGCLARVDETPNVMTCMATCAEGTTVVSQNRLGPREADFLRMTDWFFPDGMNHHELFAGVPGVQTVMQVFARRVAGLGKLPTEIKAPRAASRRSVDVLVVGAGPSGMAVATRLAAEGRAVEVIDDQIAPGGALLALDETETRPFEPIARAFADLARRGNIRIASRTVAGGLYGRDLLVAGEDGAAIVEARALVLACGAHDGVVAFENDDLPGIMSARAAGFVLAYDIVPGEKIAVVVDGGGPFGEAYARALARRFEVRKGSAPSVEVIHGTPTSARGSSRVKKIFVRTSAGERAIACDTVLVDAPRAPAYELATQAGASLAHEARGYVVRADRGRIADGVFAAGEMTGVPFEAHAIDRDAEIVAASILG